MRACHVVSVTSDSVTLGTICQAPLSMGFSRQKYCSGLLCPPPGDHPDPGTEPASLTSTPLAGGFFTTSTTWEDPGGKNPAYPQRKTWSEKMHPMLSAALFTTAKTWKPPECPSGEVWTKTMWCVYIQWNTTQPLKQWNNAICTTQMDLETVILGEVSQTVKEKCRMTSFTCGI